MYTDFKSPYSYLAFEPGLDLPERFEIELRWLPFEGRQRGAGERSMYSERKYQYSWIDVRRWGRQRGLQFEPPIKVYDSKPALIGGLFAQRQGLLRGYGREVFRRFFIRDLEIDQPGAVADVIASLGMNDDAFLRYHAGAGADDLQAAREEAIGDRVFGVPFFDFDGEQFWGNDRLALLERRLTEKGFSRTVASSG